MLMGCTESIPADTCFKLQQENPSTSQSMFHEPNPYEVDSSHYTFQRAIGSGGFGIVQHATKRSDPDKNKGFAIKSLSKASILKRKSGLVSIYTELKILASITHIFICNSHYAFQDDSYLYLVLDLARGGDLRYNLSASGGKFNEATAKFYISQVILALEYLHRIGIIHRDVKPENILLNDDGYIKLTDFGVSKVLNVKTNDCRSTSGTHGYMAPEMYISPGYRHGTAADWFALGVTLFELLVGQRPFDSKTLKGNQCSEGGIYQLYIGFMSPQEGSDLSPDCQHFLRGLLHPCPDMRLTIPLQSSERHSPQNGNIFKQPWLRLMNWEMLFYRALPAPFIPNMHIERSCLSPSDAHAVLNHHLQALPIADSEQVHFADYSLHRNNVEQLQPNPLISSQNMKQTHALTIEQQIPVPSRNTSPSPSIATSTSKIRNPTYLPSQSAALSSIEYSTFRENQQRLQINTHHKVRRAAYYKDGNDEHGLICPSSSSALSDESDQKLFKEYAACYKRRQRKLQQQFVHHYQSVCGNTSMEEESCGGNFGTDMDSSSVPIPETAAASYSAIAWKSVASSSPMITESNSSNTTRSPSSPIQHHSTADVPTVKSKYEPPKKQNQFYSGPILFS